MMMKNIIFLQKEVLTESKAMIPDTNRRLKTAIEDLKSFMVSYVMIEKSSLM